MSSSTKQPCRVLTFGSSEYAPNIEMRISGLISEGYRITSTTDNSINLRVFMVLDEAPAVQADHFLHLSELEAGVIKDMRRTAPVAPHVNVRLNPANIPDELPAPSGRSFLDVVTLDDQAVRDEMAAEIGYTPVYPGEDDE